MQQIIKLIVKFTLGLSLLFLFGCSQNKNNYVVTESFIMPKNESKFAKFNDLYPTNNKENIDAQLVTKESEEYLTPPTISKAG